MWLQNVLFGCDLVISIALVVTMFWNFRKSEAEQQELKAFEAEEGHELAVCLPRKLVFFAARAQRQSKILIAVMSLWSVSMTVKLIALIISKQ